MTEIYRYAYTKDTSLIVTQNVLGIAELLPHTFTESDVQIKLEVIENGTVLQSFTTTLEELSIIVEKSRAEESIKKLAEQALPQE